MIRYDSQKVRQAMADVLMQLRWMYEDTGRGIWLKLVHVGEMLVDSIPPDKHNRRANDEKESAQ